MKLKSIEEIKAMRAAGILAAQTLRYAESLVKPGVSTGEINDKVHEFIIAHKAIPAPLNYKPLHHRGPGFPKSICTSVNEVICHGIPSYTHILAEGDIINIDVTVILNGFHGDCSATFYVGDKIPQDRRHVTEVARESLARAIAQVKHGARLGDIGAAIQQYAEAQGCGVVRDFVGHGIGRNFHEEFQVPHYGIAGRGMKLVRGMTFTIEPMINGGRFEHILLDDGWTAVTIDKKPSAQFEHTVAVYKEGVAVLTALADDPIVARAKELGGVIVDIDD